ncbi:MAG: hypothetical protein WCV55_03035 [Candidatus Paceibacterota bacterium]
MKKKLIIISSIVGTMALVFFAVHIWVISKIEQKYSDTQNLSGNLQMDIIKNQQLSNLRRKIKNFSEQNKELLALFIKDDDIPNSIQSLETIMRNLKITGNTKSVSEINVPELKSALKNELLITFEAEAPYSNLMQFISILENLPYRSYISSVSIVKETPVQSLGQTTKSAKNDLWKLNLTLNIVKTMASQTTK